MRRVAIFLTFFVVACGPTVSAPDNQPDGGMPTHPGDDCTGAATRCDGQTHYRCNAGKFEVDATCPMACDDLLGCVSCRPNTGTCSGSMSQACKPDGSGYTSILCDPVQGMVCDTATGVCTGACSPRNLGTSYIGCEYFPTVTGNEVANEFDFAVAVSNTTGSPSNVTIEGGALTAPTTFTVAPNSLVVQKLPWVNGLKLANCSEDAVLSTGCYPSVNGGVVKNGAYHLRATQPVTVYQFSALEYQLGSDYSYTNDASLLLPSNVLTGTYYTASYPGVDTGGFETIPGLMAVTATQDGTVVTVTTTAASLALPGAPTFSPGVPQMVTLNQGDVLEITTASGDLTGSKVSATKPVQVIGGHYCTDIPEGTPACDHLEETMFPVEALSSKYIVTAPSIPSLSAPKVEVVRIIATEDNTTLSYDPPQSGAASIAKAGKFVELSGNSKDFQVTANHRILVAQYMEGQSAGGDSGDPAMTLAVGLEQYRNSYLFHAPVTYVTNYVNITAPAGAHITLDGSNVPAGTPIGNTGYTVNRIQVSQVGNHNITGDVPFGISVYGYGDYTSYWYPGGSDVAVLPISRPVSP